MMLISLRKISFTLLFIPQFLFSGKLLADSADFRRTQKINIRVYQRDQRETILFTDSLNLKKTPSTLFYYEHQFEFSDSVNYFDNSLNNFQNYLERGHLGNSGLPYNNLFSPVISNEPEFNYSKNNYSNYFSSPQNIKFFNTRTPFTDLFYVLGSKKEQIFKMTFSYNVKKNWNVTADFHRIRSEGFYPRQNTNDNFLIVSSNFKSNNNRYYFLASIIYNNVKNAENGGMLDDSVISSTGVHLSSAKRSTLNQSIFFKQYLNFGERSADTSKFNSIIPKSRLILTSMIENNILKYEDADPLSGYYPTIYFDSTKTYDSTFNYKIENELAWKRLNNNKYRGFKDIFGATFSVKQQLITVRQNEMDTAFNNISAGAEFYNTYSKNKFWWNISGKYTLSGYNKENYYTSATFKKAIKDSLNVLILKAEMNSQSPDFIYNHYSSNHFKWNNNFQQSQTSCLGIHFSALKYHFALGANVTNYTNLLFYDFAARATQYKVPVNVMTAFIKKEITLYNWHLNNKVIYQYVPEGITAIRLPEYVLEHSLYYSTGMFKDVMNIQIGASLFYTSAYYANAYMPATALFYLQNEKKQGNYPFVDFFLNAQIKSVRIFFKIDHLNSGMAGSNYSLTPNYPMNTRAFKLGISWRFYD